MGEEKKGSLSKFLQPRFYFRVSLLLVLFGVIEGKLEQGGLPEVSATRDLSGQHQFGDFERKHSRPHSGRLGIGEHGLEADTEATNLVFALGLLRRYR